MSARPATRADIAAPHIHIEPHKQQKDERSWDAPRGRRAIFVGGLMWAIAHPEAHGVHGLRYWIEQVDDTGKRAGHGIEEKGRVLEMKSRKRAEAELLGALGLHWAHQLTAEQKKALDVDVRLLAFVTKLIAEGKIIEPKLYRMNIERRARDWRARQDHVAAKLQKALEDRPRQRSPRSRQQTIPRGVSRSFSKR